MHFQFSSIQSIFILFIYFIHFYLISSLFIYLHPFLSTIIHFCLISPAGATQSDSVWLVAESALPHFCHCFFSPATQRPNHRDQHHERERAIYFRVCPGKVRMDTCPNLLLFYHPKKLAEPACHLISPFS